MKVHCFLPLLLLSFLLLPFPAFSQSLVEGLAIEVKGESREFAFTNKETAFFYGETNAENKTSWQGFNVFGQEFVDDYEIWIDEKKLERKSALKTIVYPDFLRRIYPNGIVEELRLVDRAALFSVTITSSKEFHVDVIPYFTDGRSADQYEIKLQSETAFIARKNQLIKTERKGAPVWLSIHGRGFLPQFRSRSKGTQQYSPIMMLARKAKSHTIAFGVGYTIEEADSTMRSYLLAKESYHALRRARMESLLQATHVETDNRRFDKALAWTKVSLDALMMNQVTTGIFAGLPWFSNYWGRDTFIALPGATLVLGRFTEAKQILQSFAALQQRDTNSTDYGRIPNIVTTTEKAYNTADGTPRFVIMAREYIERSGDTTFLKELYPTIARSIEGTLKYHCDSLGFLTHGDQETWMDAAGPDGCWSPRGNRANDIQALWSQQLETGIWFATKLGKIQPAELWAEQLEKLRHSFPLHFLVNGTVTDHLNMNGSVDAQVRPNQIFTSGLLREVDKAATLKSVVSQLTYTYGVASLSQDDPDFHPYHQNDPYYPKDAAYHNGTVWTWLQGPVISELCYFGKQELAWKVTENSIHQILDRGAVGTQSELLDAIAGQNEKEPRLSGTFSQAWNLAEFIRNFYDDYLGIRVSLLNHHLVLRPRLPLTLGSIKAAINLNGRSLPIQVTQAMGSTKVLIDGRNLRKGGTAEIVFDVREKAQLRAEFNIPSQSVIAYMLKDTAVSLYVNEVRRHNLKVSYVEHKLPVSLDSLRFAKPKLRDGLRALRGPDYPLLGHSQVKTTTLKVTTLVDARDPANDDVGTGAFTYPSNPHLVRGSLDLTNFSMRYDKARAYFMLKFKTLSNPGWHPEYGFQLTYVAIAIDQDGMKNSGKQFVEHNANYMLSGERAYEKIILIGGGIRLEDKEGKILAAYVPRPDDVSNPLGNAEDGTISFALPLSYLGKPSSSWTLTVLVGAQDDHGGAGIGEFRTVNKVRGEWSGGGKKNSDESNVYDVLVASGR